MSKLLYFHVWVYKKGWLSFLASGETFLTESDFNSVDSGEFEISLYDGLHCEAAEQFYVNENPVSKLENKQLSLL